LTQAIHAFKRLIASWQNRGIHRACGSAVAAARVKFQVCWRQWRIAFPSMMYQASRFAPFLERRSA